MPKKRLVLKTEFGGKETYGLFRDAALHKHQRNKHVIALLKKKKSRVVTTRAGKPTIFSRGMRASHSPPLDKD